MRSTLLFKTFDDFRPVQRSCYVPDYLLDEPDTTDYDAIYREEEEEEYQDNYDSFEIGCAENNRSEYLTDEIPF